MSMIKMLAVRNGVTYNQTVARKRLPAEIREYFVKMGRKGGLLGGAARAAKLTPQERSESARKAVLARWRKGNTEIEGQRS